MYTTKVYDSATLRLEPMLKGIRAIATVCLFIAVGASLSPAQGATFTWDASGTHGSAPTDGAGTWSTSAANWSNGSTDAAWSNSDSTDNAVFGSGGAGGAVTVSGGVTVGNITFNPVTSPYTIGSSTITLTGGAITVNAASATINSALAGTVGLTTSGTGTLTLGGVNTFSGNVLVSSGTLTIASSGQGFGANTVGRTVTIDPGATMNSLTTDSIDYTSGVVNNLAFIIQGTWNNNPANTANTGFERIDNITLQGGTINDSGQHPGSYGGILFGATVNISGSTASVYNQTGNGVGLGAGSGTVFNVANVTGNSSPSFTINGGIRNTAVATGYLTKIGAGTMLLNGSSSYTGPTFIGAGILQIGNGGTAGSIAGTSAISGSSGGTLEFDLSSSGTLTQGISSGIGFTQAGSAAQTLSGANTYTGLTTVSSGTLSAGIASVANSSGAFGNNSAVTLANVAGAALNITGFSTQIGSLTGGGATGGNVILGSATLTVGGDNTSPAAFAGVISGGGALTKIGTGTLNLSGANTYSGITTVSAGTIEFDNESALYNDGTSSWTGSNIIVKSGGTLALAVGASPQFTSADLGTLLGMTSSATAGFETGSILGLDTTNASGGTFTYGNTIANGYGGSTLGLAKLGAGTLALTASNSYTGGTTVAGGILNINVDAALGGASSGVTFTNSATLQSGSNNITLVSTRGITLSTGVTATIDTQTNAMTINGVIGGAGSLTETGTGALTLGGVNTFSGNLLVSTGTLTIASSSQGFGSNTVGKTVTIAPGATLNSLTTDAIDYGSTTVNNVALVIQGTWNNDPANTAGTGFQRVDNITLQGATINDWGQLSSYGGILFAATVNVSGSTASVYNQMGNGLGFGGGTTLFNIADVTGNASPDFTINGGIRNTAISVGSVIKTGSGTMLLTGASSYSGATLIGAGVLQLGNGILTSSIATTSGVSGSSGATLAFDLNNSSTFATAITGGLGLVQMGAGTVALTASNSYTGGTVISSGTLDINADAALGAASGGLTFTNGGSLQAGANNISLSASRGITLNPGVTGTFDTQSNTMTINGVIGGSTGALTKIGSGTLILTASNTYGGATTINGGTLQLGNGGTAGSIGSTSGYSGSSGVLAFDFSSPLTYSSALTGGIGVTQSGSGTLTLTASNSYTGGTTVAGGILNISSDTALGGTSGGVAFSGTGTLQIANTINLSPGRAVTLNTGAAGTIDTQGNALTVNGAIGGAGSLTKIGTGTLTLGGVNTFSGNLLVSTGTLTIASSSQGFGSNTVGKTVTIASGATLNSLTTDAIDYGSGSVNNVALVIQGTWNNDPANTASTGFQRVDNITLQGATINDSGQHPGSYGGILFGGTVNVSGSTASVYNQTGNGSGLGTGGATVFNVADVTGNSAPDFTVNGLIRNTFVATGALTKTGAGTMLLLGSNSYSGATVINAGILQLGNGGAVGSIATTSGVSGSSGGTLVFDTNTSGTFSPVITGGLGITQAGSSRLTLSASDNYTGQTTVTSGTLIAAGSLDGGASVSGGATLNVAGTITNSASVTGSGTIIVQGAIGGSVTVAGGAVDGVTGIGGNAVIGSGSGTASSSVLYPGFGESTAGAILSTNGNLNIASDGDFKFDLNTTTGATDALNIGGTLTLATGANLTGLDLGSGTLPAGTSYIVAYAGSGISGTFANAPQGGSFEIGSTMFTADYTQDGGTELVLTTVAIPEPGTLGAILLGLGMLIGLQRRRRQYPGSR